MRGALKGVRGLHAAVTPGATDALHTQGRAEQTQPVQVGMGGTGLEPGSPTRDTDGQEWSMRTHPAPAQWLRPVNA
jgi:hypothetical protein